MTDGGHDESTDGRAVHFSPTAATIGAQSTHERRQAGHTPLTLPGTIPSTTPCTPATPEDRSRPRDRTRVRPRRAPTPFARRVPVARKTPSANDSCRNSVGGDSDGEDSDDDSDDSGSSDDDDNGDGEDIGAVGAERRGMHEGENSQNERHRSRLVRLAGEAIKSVRSTFHFGEGTDIHHTGNKPSRSSLSCTRMDGNNTCPAKLATTVPQAEPKAQEPLHDGERDGRNVGDGQGEQREEDGGRSHRRQRSVRFAVGSGDGRNIKRKSRRDPTPFSPRVHHEGK